MLDRVLDKANRWRHLPLNLSGPFALDVAVAEYHGHELGALPGTAPHILLMPKVVISNKQYGKEKLEMLINSASVLRARSGNCLIARH
jgi:hypothetical protein